jgi:hypothetical protein
MPTTARTLNHTTAQPLNRASTKPTTAHSLNRTTARLLNRSTAKAIQDLATALEAFKDEELTQNADTEGQTAPTSNLGEGAMGDNQNPLARMVSLESKRAGRVKRARRKTKKERTT